MKPGGGEYGVPRGRRKSRLVPLAAIRCPLIMGTRLPHTRAAIPSGAMGIAFVSRMIAENIATLPAKPQKHGKYDNGFRWRSVRGIVRPVVAKGAACVFAYVESTQCSVGEWSMSKNTDGRHPAGICFVGFYAWPLFKPGQPGDFGGAEVQLSTLARELARDSGYRVDFIVRDENGGSETIDGVIVHKLPLIRKPGLGRQLAYTAGLWRLLRTIGPDVVVQRAAGSLTALLGLYCAVYRKRFVYMIAHDSDVEPGKPLSFPGNAAWRAYRLGLRLADRVIVQHDRQRQRLMDNYAKVGIVRPCALEIDEAVPTGERRNILWVGRCERIKQPEIFISLAQAFPLEPFVMVCPPAASGPAYFESVRDRAQKLQNLTFVQQVPFQDIGPHFQAARLFVNTALEEGFPNTFVQAWMHGTPVVSLSVDPGGVIARHGLGIICDGSQTALGMALSSLLADRPLWERFSLKACTFARGHHDIRRQVELDRIWLSGARGD